MNVLLGKLRYIEEECSVELRRKQAKRAQATPFRSKKKTIANELRAIRESLKERDQLLGSAVAAAPSTIELGSRIRRDLVKVEAEVNELEELFKAEKKKAGKSPSEDKREELALRGDQLKVVKEHLRECKRLEKRRYTSKVDRDNRSRLMAGAAAAGVGVAGSRSGRNGAAELPDDPTMSQLAPIDDEEVEAALMRIEARNEDIDQELDAIADGVATLRDIAVEMGGELDRQNIMLDETNRRAAEVTEHIRNSNKRLSKILKKVGKDKMCMYLILLMVFLVMLLV
ncbi:uncharacterized protein AMSG_11444, partial [Thecamonas trahens ATCC 50062]